MTKSIIKLASILGLIITVAWGVHSGMFHDDNPPKDPPNVIICDPPLDSINIPIEEIEDSSDLFDPCPNQDQVDWNKGILSAIMFVESSYNDSAYRADEDAVGCLQIRKCMINDVNRVLKRQKSTKRYTYEDRWSREKSVEIYDIICNHYGWDTAEEIARCWNGGPRGINNPSTVGYWEKVKQKINS